MRKSLFLKFLLGFTIVIVISVLFIIFSVQIRARAQYTRVASETDLEQAEELALVLRVFYESTGSWQGLREVLGVSPQGAPRQMMRGMMRQNNPVLSSIDMFIRMQSARSRVVVTGPDGRMIADSAPFAPKEAKIPPVLDGGVEILSGEEVVGRVLVGSMIQPGLDRRDKAFLRSVNRTVIVAAVIGLFISLGVTLFFFRRITRPVSELSAASGSIAAGDYTVRVKEEGQDELSDLVRNFNSMAASLEKSETMKKQLIADAAHELRTPVSLIKANIEMMLEGVYKMDREQLLSIQHETERMSRMVEELQTLASAEAGNLKFDKQNVSAGKILDRMIALFCARAEEKGVVLEKKVLPVDANGTGHMVVHADEDKIVQVLTNIMSNALRYTPSGGTITLSATQEDGGIRIDIKDTGPGIPPEELSRVFERFYRLDRARSREKGGLGLGLAISREIISAHGGSIWAGSDGRNGTVVSILLL